jgi:hypothetical protein
LEKSDNKLEVNLIVSSIVSIYFFFVGLCLVLSCGVKKRFEVVDLATIKIGTLNIQGDSYNFGSLRHGIAWQ